MLTQRKYMTPEGKVFYFAKGTFHDQGLYPSALTDEDAKALFQAAAREYKPARNETQSFVFRDFEVALHVKDRWVDFGLLRCRTSRIYCSDLTHVYCGTQCRSQ